MAAKFHFFQKGLLLAFVSCFSLNNADATILAVVANPKPCGEPLQPNSQIFQGMVKEFHMRGISSTSAAQVPQFKRFDLIQEASKSLAVYSGTHYFWRRVFEMDPTRLTAEEAAEKYTGSGSIIVNEEYVCVGTTWQILSVYAHGLIRIVHPSNMFEASITFADVNVVHRSLQQNGTLGGWGGSGRWTFRCEEEHTKSYDQGNGVRAKIAICEPGFRVASLNLLVRNALYSDSLNQTVYTLSNEALSCQTANRPCSSKMADVFRSSTAKGRLTFEAGDIPPGSPRRNHVAAVEGVTSHQFVRKNGDELFNGLIFLRAKTDTQQVERGERGESTYFSGRKCHSLFQYDRGTSGVARMIKYRDADPANQSTSQFMCGGTFCGGTPIPQQIIDYHPNGTIGRMHDGTTQFVAPNIPAATRQSVNANKAKVHAQIVEVLDEVIQP